MDVDDIDWNKTSVSVLSDALVHHAELMYSSNVVPSIAGLCDLAELCHAAITHDYLLATPEAAKNSTFLRALDNVLVWRGDLKTYVEDIAAGGLDFDDNPLLVPAALAWAIRYDTLLGGYFDPRGTIEPIDRASSYLRQFPLVMLVAMHHHGLDVFAEDAGEAAEEVAESVKHFQTYARETTGTAKMLCGDYAASVLEQPLLDLVRTDAPIEGVEEKTIRQVFREEMDSKVESVRDLGLAEWHVPAIGTHVLHLAKDLDALPHEIARARERFAQYRSTIVEKERERRRFLTEGEGGSLRAGLRELDKLVCDIREAHESMAVAIDDGRLRSGSETIDRRRETIRSGLQIVMSLAGATPAALEKASGVPLLRPIEKLLEKLGIPNYFALLRKTQLVKGLYRAQSFFDREDARALQGVDALAKRYLGLPHETMHVQRYIFANALEFSRNMAAGASGGAFDFGEMTRFWGEGRREGQVDSRLAWVVYGKDLDAFARQFQNVREGG